MQVAIIDYGSGNLRSAAKAFQRMAREAGVQADIAVTADPDGVARADRIVLPGVGAFGDCLEGIAAIDGMPAAIEEAVIAKARPFFGICVGMQLMAERGLEHGVHPGFGWIKGDVARMEPADPALKIPHMGWNEVVLLADHPLFRDLPARHAYFVHSYVLEPANENELVASADYACRVTAAVARDNLFGSQFHPEKSQGLGLALIRNFLTWAP